MLAQDDGGWPPQQACGSHIVLLFLDHDGPPHRAGVLHPVGQGDDDVDGHVVAVARRQRSPRNAEDEQRHQQDGKGQLHVGQAHDERIHPATPIAGQHTETDTDEHRQQHGDAPDQHRHAQAVEDGREHVPALIVRPQPVGTTRDARLARTGEGVEQVQRRRVERVLRSQPRGQHGQQHAGCQHQQGKLGQAGGGQTAQQQRVGLAPGNARAGRARGWDRQGSVGHGATFGKWVRH